MPDLLKIIEIPENEKEAFERLIKEARRNIIRTPKAVVGKVFSKRSSHYKNLMKHRNVSDAICGARESAWKEFLKEESDFNTEVLKKIVKELGTPRRIIDSLIEKNIVGKEGENLTEAVKITCGEYAGRIYPYIYMLSLSNTNSRRSRSGSTFEGVIYKAYEYLGYPFDSQKKIGTRQFEKNGLGKKVDSVLPGMKYFNEMRTKVIIGTMKTSLRERWQEVAEEIKRTNLPQIHLLTVDDKITKSKAEEMRGHNITIVAPLETAESEKMGGMRNIISFEEYFFKEIPEILKYWNIKPNQNV